MPPVAAAIASAGTSSSRLAAISAARSSCLQLEFGELGRIAGDEPMPAALATTHRDAFLRRARSRTKQAAAGRAGEQIAALTGGEVEGPADPFDRLRRLPQQHCVAAFAITDWPVRGGRSPMSWVTVTASPALPRTFATDRGTSHPPARASTATSSTGRSACAVVGWVSARSRQAGKAPVLQPVGEAAQRGDESCRPAAPNSAVRRAGGGRSRTARAVREARPTCPGGGGGEVAEAAPAGRAWRGRHSSGASWRVRPARARQFLLAGPPSRTSGQPGEEKVRSPSACQPPRQAESGGSGDCPLASERKADAANGITERRYSSSDRSRTPAAAEEQPQRLQLCEVALACAAARRTCCSSRAPKRRAAAVRRFPRGAVQRTHARRRVGGRERKRGRKCLGIERAARGRSAEPEQGRSQPRQGGNAGTIA